MEVLIVLAALVGLCAGPAWLVWYFTRTTGSSLKSPIPPSGFRLPSSWSTPTSEILEDRVRSLYLRDKLTDDEFEDLMLYVGCGGMINSQGIKVGISDEGYRRLQMVRERMKHQPQ